MTDKAPQARLARNFRRPRRGSHFGIGVPLIASPAADHRTHRKKLAILDTMLNVTPSTRTGPRLVGSFLFFLGLSAMWFGASLLFNGGPDATAAASCKAICGLATLASFVLGPVAGPIVGGGLTFLVGLAIAFVGRAAYQD